MNPATNYRSQASFERAMQAYERTLSGWPVPAQQRTIGTSIGDAFVLSWGEASNPPLILLHGSAANSSTWGDDAERFATAFRVNAIDLPGETGKSTPVRPPYAGSAYNDWLAKVLDGLAIERVSIVGLSLGGWAALRFAAARPERVERLVLLAPGGIARARTKFVALAAVFSLFGRRGIDRLTNLVFSPEPAPPGVAEGFAFMLQHYRARRDNLPVIPDAELAAVIAPTLLLGGRRDALLDMPATAARIARLVPHALVEIDPNGGHAVIRRGDRVLEFLTTVSGGPPAANDRRPLGSLSPAASGEESGEG